MVPPPEPSPPLDLTAPTAVSPVVSLGASAGASPIASPGAAAAVSFSSPGARRALGGFFISGVLLSFLGAILPAWGHHITSDYVVIGWYFVGLIAGLVGWVWIR